jgi:hypothetical protein
MTPDAWTQLADTALEPHVRRLRERGVEDLSFALEGVIGAAGAQLSDGAGVLRSAQDADVAVIRAFLGDPIRRHFVKLLVFAARCVPAPIFNDMVATGVAVRNPSFNKHFIWPCVLERGRRAVVERLLHMYRSEASSGLLEQRRFGFKSALYWGAMPRHAIYWPDATSEWPPAAPPDEPVDDLLGQCQQLGLAL